MGTHHSSVNQGKILKFHGIVKVKTYRHLLLYCFIVFGYLRDAFLQISLAHTFPIVIIILDYQPD